MCGRYALALRPAQIRAQLADLNMWVEDTPDDEDEEIRETYNFAPGYNGIVYRADVPDDGSGGRRRAGNDETAATDGTHEPDSEDGNGAESAGPTGTDGAPSAATKEPRYKLQKMKWGLIPFWTKRKPDYGGLMRTINCRDDSLLENRGMWTTMKQRKRCLVIAQGFYEWQKRNGGRDKIPHFVKRKDGQLMLFAGLWDCVQYEGDAEKLYTYTIITTSPNKQLTFLHDRMPVILEPASDQTKAWLDPRKTTWTEDLQSILQPFPGELECYPVSKDVGKVGNNSPTFIVPLNSKENKNNIANFFGKTGPSSIPNPKSAAPEAPLAKQASEGPPSAADGGPAKGQRQTPQRGHGEDSATPIPKEPSPSPRGQKRPPSSDGGTASPPARSPLAAKALKAEPVSSQEVVADVKTSLSKMTSPTKVPGRPTRSATSNGSAANKNAAKRVTKTQAEGNRKITSFFGK